MNTDPIVVMKLVVKESSEKRNNRQLFPTPAKTNEKRENNILDNINYRLLL